MSVLRLLVAWLIMAAVPLQGFAAASMVFCKGDHHPTAIGQAAGAGPTGMGGHDHASHSHGVATQPDPAAGQTADAQLPDNAHKCGVCASCCHSLAVAQQVHWPSFSPAPQAGWAEPFVLIFTTPTSVLDKPPRA